jgi:hypothetical protein
MTGFVFFLSVNGGFALRVFALDIRIGNGILIKEVNKQPSDINGFAGLIELFFDIGFFSD